MTLLGTAVLTTWPMRAMLQYFNYEEFHEITEEELAERSKKGERFIFCFHPHGIFPFCAACSLVSSLGAEDNQGRVSSYPDKSRLIENHPTAVASVLLRVPVLKDIIGMFGVIDASSATLRKWLQKRSCALYVGGMLELFHASADDEAVVLKKRKGFVK